jgi:hypothetical protein
MGADLRALGRVKSALEQRAEDRRLDVAPVLGIDENERLDLVPGEVDDLGVGEQAAVEMADDVGAEFPPVAMAWKRFPSRRDRPAVSRRDCVKTRSNSLPGKSSMSSANMQNISFMRKWAMRCASASAVQVADDEERRIFQVLATKLKLFVGRVQVPVFFLYSQAKWPRSQTSAQPREPSDL